MYKLAASLATLASWLAPAEGRQRASSASARHRPAAGGQVHGRFEPERKLAYGRWAGTLALRARKGTGLWPVGRYTGASRPKGNRLAAGGQVHGRFAPGRKPACGRWAGTRALRARKEIGLRPVGR